MKPVLIIVDAQYDFAHPDGSLYVPNGNAAVEKIIEFIKTNHSNLGTVVFTMDNHPLTHCSFKVNGGPWPNHCVQDTHGAEILPQLIEACTSNGLNYKFLKKGEKPNVWEYTAFSRTRKIGNGLVTILRSETHAVIVSAKEYIICGFAGDYCVKDSIRDLGAEVGMENIKVFNDGVANIDDGTIFNDFILKNGLTVVDVNNEVVSKRYTLKELGLPSTIYMAANIKAFKSRVIPLTLSEFVYKTGEDDFTCVCSNADEGYSVSFNAKDLILKKHERKSGFGEGRYRYFANEEDAKQYIVDRGW